MSQPTVWNTTAITSVVNRRVWRIIVDSAPEYFGELLSGNGPNVFLEPVGWVCFRIIDGSGDWYTPWQPVVQRQSIIVAPLVAAPQVAVFTGNRYPGVTWQVTLVQNA